MNEPQMEPEKGKKQERTRAERRKERKGGRKINFPEQRQAGLMED